MKHQLIDTQIHIATGGRSFSNDGEVLVLLHGSGQNHLSWVLQSRYLAYRGYQVLAPDFPGHGLSGGTPLESIEDMADWVIALLDSLDVKTACLVGHSQGCLVAIDATARYPERVSRLGLIAGALAIPVNDQLLTMSDEALGKAISVMTSWGHGPMAHMHDNTQPGHSFQKRQHHDRPSPIVGHRRVPQGLNQQQPLAFQFFAQEPEARSNLDSNPCQQ